MRIFFGTLFLFFCTAPWAHAAGFGIRLLKLFTVKQNTALERETESDFGVEPQTSYHPTGKISLGPLVGSQVTLPVSDTCSVSFGPDFMMHNTVGPNGASMFRRISNFSAGFGFRM